MTNQAPNPLPAELPAGTISTYGFPCAGVATLKESVYHDGAAYWGQWGYEGNVADGYVLPSRIDWSSVTPPKPADAPKLCDCCGDPSSPAHFNDDHRSAWGNRVDWEKALSTANLCKGCATGARGMAQQVGEAILARRSSTPAVERPIQAGDWVECLPNGAGLRLDDGARYEVESVDSYGLIHLVAHGSGFDNFRFKRVDGPHPDRIATQCSDGQCGGCDSCIQRQRDYYAEKAQSSAQAETHCPECATTLTPETVGRAPFCRGCTERWQLAALVGLRNKCSECNAPAALDPDCGMCAYCVTSTGHGDERRDEQDRIMRFSTDRHHGAEARARNEAALAQERPSGNRADAIAFRKPHPWEEF